MSPRESSTGSEAGVATRMRKAVAGGEREQREGASGKWIAHWKMVHIVRPAWEKAGTLNRLSILWEWLHKGAVLTDDDAQTGARAGDTFTAQLFARFFDEEYAAPRGEQP